MNTKLRFTVFTILVIASFVLAACGTTITIPGGPQPTATLSPQQQAQLAQACSVGDPVGIRLEADGQVYPCPDTAAPAATSDPAAKVATLTGPTSCTGYYGNMLFDVPAGQTANYQQPKGESVDITCSTDGRGLTVVQKHTDGLPYTNAEIQALLTATVAAPDPTVESPFTTVITDGSWPTNLFRTPVGCTGKFNDESSWIICEPGVLLDNSTAWTIPSTDQIYSSNVPEGAFTYYSCGQCTISVDGVTLTQKAEKGLNYLILIRGRIDDMIVDNDLNETAKISAFVPGHMIYSHMPTGAYASRDWFKQQLVASSTSKFTNCGATGCTRTRIVLYDVDSHFYQRFEVLSGNLDNWRLLEEGTK